MVTLNFDDMFSRHAKLCQVKKHLRCQLVVPSQPEPITIHNKEIHSLLAILPSLFLIRDFRAN